MFSGFRVFRSVLGFPRVFEGFSEGFGRIWRVSEGFWNISGALSGFRASEDFRGFQCVLGLRSVLGVRRVFEGFF